MYIFNDKIKEALINANGYIINPLEPPYIEILKGKRVIKQKLGAYLAKNYPNEDKLVKELVEEYKEINGNLEHYHVKHTKEYVDIYKHSLYAIDSTVCSCMKGSASVKVYDYDERLSLLVAYKDSKLVLRTLVRSDRMEYVRIYINHNLIKSHIAKAIVSRAGYTEGDLEGIKLEYIEENNDIVCPFLDKTCSFDIIDEEYLLISQAGKYQGNNTNGYITKENDCLCTCNHCWTRVDIVGSYYFDLSDSFICHDCFDRHYILYNDEPYLIRDCITNLSTNEYIPLEHITSEDLVCTENGDWYHIADVICINDHFYCGSDCVYLVQEDNNHNTHALKKDTIYNPNELNILTSGYWVKEQIIDVLTKLKSKLDNLQTDLFEEKYTYNLTTEEINILIIEIIKIEELI